VLTTEQKLMPPEQFQIMNDTVQSFIRIGDRFVGHFRDSLALDPDSHILEIGSGNGRIARALTHFVRHGSYTGVEIMPDFVRWCSQAYQDYPNFQFRHIDVYNPYYFDTGTHRANEFTFPFEDQRFDFIFLTSVITHMLRPEFERYLSEIRRMLKAGGCCFITCFIIDTDTLEQIDAGQTRRSFSQFDDVSYVSNLKKPEAAVAYERRYLEQVFREQALRLERVEYGLWREAGSKANRFNQDYLLAFR
jgi:SAM-dependent methyltransferase